MTIPDPIAITRQEQIAIALRMMEPYAGMFVRRLGAALSFADPDNAAKIVAMWPEEIAKYRALAEGRAE